MVVVEDYSNGHVDANLDDCDEVRVVVVAFKHTLHNISPNYFF